MTRYFVTGGTGLLGRFLVERLLARGKVVLLVRPERAAQHAERIGRLAELGELELAHGDVTTPGLGVSIDPASFDHVFHAAALYDLEADEAAIRAANVD